MWRTVKVLKKKKKFGSGWLLYLLFFNEDVRVNAKTCYLSENHLINVFFFPQYIIILPCKSIGV